MWIDSDVGFHPDAVEQLRSQDLPIVCGIYPKKGPPQIACTLLPGTKKLVFGRNGGVHEIKYAGTGFLLIRREVYTDIQQKLNLPVCNQHFGNGVVPWFQPMLSQHKDGQWYLGEDYAFCERARQAGHQVMADTRIRLWHFGQFGYGWEDAGRDPERYSDYTYMIDQ